MDLYQSLLSFGVVAGLLTLVPGIAAAVGVSALLAASELAYRALTFAGAAYMVWLGASLLWKSRAKDPSSAAPAAEVEVPAASRHQVIQGWLTGTGTVLIGFGLRLALEPRR